MPVEINLLRSRCRPLSYYPADPDTCLVLYEPPCAHCGGAVLNSLSELCLACYDAVCAGELVPEEPQRQPPRDRRWLDDGC